MKKQNKRNNTCSLQYPRYAYFVFVFFLGKESLYGKTKQLQWQWQGQWNENKFLGREEKGRLEKERARKGEYSYSQQQIKNCVQSWVG